MLSSLTAIQMPQYDVFRHPVDFRGNLFFYCPSLLLAAMQNCMSFPAANSANNV
jgi:hypothetical protein